MLFENSPYIDQLVCSKVDLDQQCFTSPYQRLYNVCIFLFEVLRKLIKKLVRSSRDLCMPLSIHSKQLGNIIRGAHDQRPSSNFSKKFENGFESFSTSNGTTTSHVDTCTCKRVHPNSVCISFEHFKNPI